MLNKKADMAVVVLVFVVLLTTIIALFTFLQSDEEINAKISESSVIGFVKLDEDLSKIYVRRAGQEALKGMDKDNFNENFFRTRFKNEFQKYGFENMAQGLKENIAKDGFETSFDGNVLTVIIEDLSLEKSFEGANVKYNFNIEEEFILES